ncbi:hypothetical protein [Streptomyces ortus]|uniref:Uncharacterized protein n=1 Tax=Streptomyces ortus TaxID=2867268 RepID=A0ABT3UZL5_9ACTN|nr:hypothetical protein [Streptomyces ortus]MCX4231840.1 hypothetical protein [Streptomyces ortus]
MEDVRGAVNVILYGPTEDFDRTLTAIQNADITAKRDAYEDQAISAFFHDGTDRPSQAFVQQCEDRVRAVVEGTSFTVNRTSVWGSNAATRQLPCNRHTGQWLGSFIDSESPLEIREQMLQDLAKAYGISVNDIELRDPDYLRAPES